MAAPRALWVLGVASLLLGAAGAVSASPTPRTSVPEVLAVHSSAYTIEQASFTVGIEVANPSAVSFAYFTFCQLSSALCYKPVAMAANGSNWFAGTTNLMSSYSGMVVGVRAGYNITIDFSNNTNVTEPALPNLFPSQTIATEVTGEYMFQMTVGPNLYSVSGVVKNSASGAGVAGATVAVTPGNNSTTTDASGAYTLGGLPNGTYTLSISRSGYTTTTQGVTISGQNAQQNVPISNGTGGTTAPSGHGATSAWSGTDLWIAVGVAVIVVVGLLAALLMRRGRGGPGRAAGASPDLRADGSAPK